MSVVIIILGGFVGQPIPGRRVASGTSIAAPIATTITVSIHIFVYVICLLTVFEIKIKYLGINLCHKIYIETNL